MISVAGLAIVMPKTETWVILSAMAVVAMAWIATAVCVLQALSQEVNASIMDYSANIDGEIERIRGLVADAVVSLSDGFTGLERLSHREQEMVLALIDRMAAVMSTISIR